MKSKEGANYFSNSLCPSFSCTFSQRTMADWSQLPKELLQLISERLDDSTLYLLRFRSVCSTWRSSIPKPQPPHLALEFPVFSKSNRNDDACTFSVYKHTIFLITPPQQQQRTLRPWLTAIGQDSRGQTHLWHPLFREAPLRFRFPQELDFNQHRVFHLGHRFAHAYPALRDSTCMIKVVVATWQQAKSEGFCSVLLSILDFGELALFRCDDQRWTLIPDSPTPYRDVCLFKGRPCAVDCTGRTVMVGPDLSVDLVAEPEPETVLGGDKKYLVESEGELLLVDMYSENFYVHIDKYSWWLDKVVRLDVFRLEEKEKKWVQLTSLGDRILFLAYDCTFSASASDLGVGEGNCVIFRDDYESCMTVFHLDDGRFSYLSDLVYDQLFCPPLDWAPLHRQGGSERTDLYKDYVPCNRTVIKYA